MKSMKWTADQEQFLADNYPLKGKMWCVEALGMTEHQVRYKASVMALVARGISEAWQQKQVSHSKKLTGRKRPEQAAVFKRAILDNGLHIPTPEARKLLSEKMVLWIQENGHHRGMSGKTHSARAKEKMSAAGLARSAQESEDVKSDRTLKMMKTKANNGILVTPRIGTTWKSGWRDVGGQRKYFRSKWEANYARYLQFLVESGEIRSWEHEPVTFWFDEIKRGCRSYLPDFRVTENNGSEVFHEVKGWMDDRSKTKIRRMSKYHPTVKLIVIEAKGYNEIRRKLSQVCNGWEE
jgi:hypothetical protein